MSARWATPATVRTLLRRDVGTERQTPRGVDPDGWRPTPALVRALGGGGLGAVLAVGWGRPDLAVLAAPLLVVGLIGLVGRPTGSTARGVPIVRLGGRTVREGQRVSVTTEVAGLDAAEEVTRCYEPDPLAGPKVCATSHARAPGPAPVRTATSVVVRRWGTHAVGPGTLAASAGWGAWRWGPQPVLGLDVLALPSSADFAARSQVPHPVGLVGAHQSPRNGDGSEFAGIRPFVAGDRLRRINWRVSLATGELHVVETRADQDAAVLVLVDALADAGDSGGIGGSASSLDLGVRAAAALAEHHLRIGDRVALRALGSAASIGFGAGAAHRMRILVTLARMGRQHDEERVAERLRFGLPSGTVVLLVTPMLHRLSGQVAATLVRGGASLVVVDTLPETVVRRRTTASGRAVGDTAWRMRLLERDLLLAEAARAGCPVVPWRGPGTLDEVMRRLALVARQPRLVSR